MTVGWLLWVIGARTDILVTCAMRGWLRSHKADSLPKSRCFLCSLLLWKIVDTCRRHGRQERKDMITVTETTSAHRLVSSRRISLCRHILGAGAALALVGAAAMPAHADVIFSDFGPGGSFGSADFNIYGQGGSYVYIPQFQFTASASGALNEIDVSLDYGNKPGTVQVVLYSSVGNAVGSALGTWTLTGLPSYGSAIATAAGITGVNLVAGTSYFLAAMSINGTYSWNDNSQLVRGQTYDVQSGNSSNFGVETTGAFDLIGTTVSEPATLALLGAGIFGIAAIRRRRSA